MLSSDKLKLRTYGLLKFYASRREAGYYMRAWTRKRSNGSMETDIIVEYMGSLCQRSFRQAKHQPQTTRPLANFTLSMNLDDPSVANRFVRDLATALTDWYARRLFRVLRGRAFRRVVRKRVAARLVLAKSSSRLADLPAVLVHSICVEWL